MDTPKHLMAIAASKNTAARGYVNCATAKKEAPRCGVFLAATDKRYRPNAATDPEKIHVNIPGIIPADAIACYTHQLRPRNVTTTIPEGRSAFLRSEVSIQVGKRVDTTHHSQLSCLPSFRYRSQLWHVHLPPSSTLSPSWCFHDLAESSVLLHRLGYVAQYLRHDFRRKFVPFLNRSRR